MYKANIDGTNAKKLTDEAGMCLNYYNGWLYFIGYNDEYIYKIRTDGTGKTVLSKGNYRYLKVYNGKIYCVDYTYHQDYGDYGYYEENIFYSMNLDGSNKKKIAENIKPWYINFSDNYIYYVDTYFDSIVGTINRMNLDGSSKTILNINESTFLNVVGKKCIM